jgi:hypothetical protein
LNFAGYTLKIEQIAVGLAQGAVKTDLQRVKDRSAMAKDKLDKLNAEEERERKERKQITSEEMLQTAKRDTEVSEALIGAILALVEQNKIIVSAVYGIGCQFTTNLPL